MLSLHSINHSVGGKPILNGLTYSFNQLRYGLVGPNGVGKTTLAKILCGIISPDSGVVHGSSNVTYVSQMEEMPSLLLSEYLMSVWENLNSSEDFISRWVSTLNLDRKINELSGGEWMKARLIKALARRSNFLILDEPSNNLDREGREILLEFVDQYKEGLLVISHDRELLEKMDVILELSNQGLSAYGGSFSFYWDERHKERERGLQELSVKKKALKKTEVEKQKKQDRQLKRMNLGAKKAAKGGIPKIVAGAMKRRSQATMGKIVTHEAAAVSKATEDVTQQWAQLKQDPFIRLDFEGAQAPSKKQLIYCENLNWKFDGSSHALWQNPIDLILKGSERWHIQGPNGSGKSTLLKILLGKTTDGSLTGTAELKVESYAYLDQKYGALDPSLSLLENIREDSRFDVVELRNELAFYGFTNKKVNQKVETLSGGELLKASLAKCFLGQKIPELIILDEPTNNLDIMSLELLEKALNKFKGALLIVSHDLSFVENIGITNQMLLEKRT